MLGPWVLSDFRVAAVSFRVCGSGNAAKISSFQCEDNPRKQTKLWYHSLSTYMKTRNFTKSITVIYIEICSNLSRLWMVNVRILTIPRKIHIENDPWEQQNNIMKLWGLLYHLGLLFDCLDLIEILFSENNSSVLAASMSFLLPITAFSLF